MTTYLDHAATTPMTPAAREAMVEQMALTGNASSLHGPGRDARRVVEESRERIASALGARPSEIVFTSGGTEADNLAITGSLRAARAADPLRSRVIQAVCSPIRNPLPRSVRVGTAFLSRSVAGPLGRAASIATRVPRPPLRWSYVEGPWFDNNLATLEVQGRGLRMWWARGVVSGDAHDRPEMEQVADITIDAPR